MDFIKMRDKLIEHFESMTKNAERLFEVNVDKDELWNLYLDSFPKGTNEIYRKRREYDCSCCRSFIKSIGNAVVIKGNRIETIWDFDTNDSTFQPVLEALSSYIKGHHISDIYVSKENKIGTLETFEHLESGDVKKWEHFYLNLPDKFVDKTFRSIGDIKGTYRDVRNVFKRSLDEITEDSVLTVLELISQNSLYKGEEWKYALNEFLKYKREYSKIKSDN